MTVKFQARKPTHPHNTSNDTVALEVLKHEHILGVWLISKEDALRLSEELAEAAK